ncbi:MAG: hypothetical protein LBE38_08300 [Deltaproteobacteria bacterium]|jgi:hypothetical protein|nr:hypothetical protein [Deltaproteobacteria bacterium]
MQKKIASLILSLAALFCLMALPSVSFAQAPLLSGLEPEELEELLAYEPPLTENDIRFYIAVVPHMLGNNPDEMIYEVADRFGLSDERAGYALLKIGLGTLILADPSLAPQIAAEIGTDAALPTATEQALIKRFQDELMQAIEAASSMQ